MSKLSKLMGAAGITIIVCSIIRWFFIFYDPSQMAIGVSIGIITLGFSYIYDWMKNTNEDIVKINKRLDSFTKWLSRNEMK